MSCDNHCNFLHSCISCAWHWALADGTHVSDNQVHDLIAFELFLGLKVEQVKLDYVICNDLMVLKYVKLFKSDLETKSTPLSCYKI